MEISGNLAEGMLSLHLKTNCFFIKCSLLAAV